ncbi:hypothetical protein G6F60_015642 [Rhizopus arrhizus]|nr:hypothetical protein G6F60_015642 [Rhizopus arrhizus]
MFGAFTLRPICALIVISDCMNLRESKFWKAGPFCRAALPTDIALSPARVDMPTSTWVGTPITRRPLNSSYLNRGR